MSISASLVKELRERTGAGMMDCKKALQAADGDIEKAIEQMRKSGQTKADKKADRITAEGKIFVASNEDRSAAVMLEINCETDFVSRDEHFNGFAEQAAETALAQQVSSVEQLAEQTIKASGEAVEVARKNLVSKIGENIQLRRLQLINSKGHIGSYVHGGRIGVLVELEGGNEQLAKDIAMHIAAANPVVVSGEDVPSELIEKEKEIFTAQAKESGKPADIIEKMVQGRIKKYLAAVTLLGQAFVKDPNTSVADLLQKEKAKVINFTRFVVGEGIEKKQDNFVEEVMAQVKESQAS